MAARFYVQHPYESTSHKSFMPLEETYVVPHHIDHSVRANDHFSAKSTSPSGLTINSSGRNKISCGENEFRGETKRFDRDENGFYDLEMHLCW